MVHTYTTIGTADQQMNRLSGLGRISYMLQVLCAMHVWSKQDVSADSCPHCGRKIIFTWLFDTTETVTTCACAGKNITIKTCSVYVRTCVVNKPTHTPNTAFYLVCCDILLVTCDTLDNSAASCVLHPLILLILSCLYVCTYL